MQFYQNLPDFEFPPEFGNVSEYFRHLVVEGLAQRYPKENETKGEAWEIIKKRSDYEMDLIIRLNFINYFLIVSDYINWAKNHGIPVGPGRGNTGGSIVAYALRITEIDPLKYNLLFERILNPEKFCLSYFACTDFSAEEYDKIIEYIKEKYGQERVGHTLIYDERKKTYFIHPAGIIICKSSLHDFLPVTKDKKTGVNTVQCSIDELENCGLERFDILGLKTLDIIKHTVELIHKLGGEFAHFTIEEIPEDDRATFSLFGDCETDNVFQFASDGMKEILKQAKPEIMTDLIALNSLYRPGPMQYIQQFIDSKNGKQEITYPDPCLEDILKETYGIIVYQEQIMMIIQRITSYSLGEADLVRRILGKRDKEQTEKEKERFISAALSHGFEQQQAANLFDLIASFAPFAFNKSHAVAYTLIAYQTAYLKAHFPEQYKIAYCKYLEDVVE